MLAADEQHETASDLEGVKMSDLMAYREFKLGVPIWDISDDDKGDSHLVRKLFTILGVTPPATSLMEIYLSFYDEAAAEYVGDPDARANRGDLFVFRSETDDKTLIAFDMFDSPTDAMNVVSIAISAPRDCGDEIAGVLESIRSSGEVTTALLDGNLGVQEELAKENFPRTVSETDGEEVWQHVRVYRGGKMIQTSDSSLQQETDETEAASTDSEQASDPRKDPRFDPYNPDHPFPVDSTKGTVGRRYIAASVDNTLAVIAALFLAKRFPDSQVVLQVSVTVIVYLAYFLIFEGLFRTTPMKYLTGLTIRNFDGGPASFRQSVIRTLLRVIDFNPMLLGGLPAGLMIILTRDKQRLGDKLARTVVVRR